MKKTILTIAGAMLLSLSTANAQEADRFVGAQHVKFQTACHPEDVKHYDTKLLRERFVMEKVMAPDSILLTYSHYDRFIFGGAMPVNTTLTLENFFELGLDVDKDIKEKYFMYNRELGVVNCGLGDGVVIVDGKEYALSPKEALYIGRGHIGKGKDVNKSVQFRSKDAIARCAKTQFKPGHRPANAKPVGYERINDDGHKPCKGIYISSDRFQRPFIFRLPPGSPLRIQLNTVGYAACHT